MTETTMTPPDRLGEPTVVIAERAHYAHNWARREYLTDAVTLGEDGDPRALYGLPRGVLVHLVGRLTLSPDLRAALVPLVPLYISHGPTETGDKDDY